MTSDWEVHFDFADLYLPKELLIYDLIFPKSFWFIDVFIDC